MFICTDFLLPLWQHIWIRIRKKYLRIQDTAEEIQTVGRDQCTVNKSRKKKEKEYHYMALVCVSADGS
jgi:hypothetical protein